MKKTILALALTAGLTSFAGNAKAQATETNSIDSNDVTDFTIEAVAYNGSTQANPAVHVNPEAAHAKKYPQTINYNISGGFEYTGLGASPDANTNTHWNHLVLNGTTSGDVYSDGSASPITVQISSTPTNQIGTVSSPYNQPKDLFYSYAYNSLSGVIRQVPAGYYNLYIYSGNGASQDGRYACFTASADMTSAIYQISKPYRTNKSFVRGQNYLLFKNLHVGQGHQVNFFTFNPWEADFNGIQLVKVK